MTRAELLCKSKLTPSQMKRLGKWVHIFKTGGEVYDFLAENSKRQTARNLYTESTVWTKFPDSKVWCKGWTIGSLTVKPEYAVIVAG